MPDDIAKPADTPTHDRVRSAAVLILLLGILAIAAGYALAFRAEGAAAWSAWMLALGIPTSLTAVMILGAARGRRGVGTLKAPFAIVFVMLVVGFGAAISLPATESATSALWLGLPARAAIVIYGIGLLPIVILPIAYALTFETQTLDARDIETVRALGRERALISPNVSGSGPERRVQK